MKKNLLIALFIITSFVSNAQFSQVSNIYPTNITEGDEFGSAVAIDGDFMAIGAYYYNDASISPGTGSVYMWHYNGTDWEYHSQIIPANNPYNGDQFGNAVAISGNDMIVGAWNGSTDGDYNPGTVTFYNFDGTSWTGEMKWVCGINDYDLGYGTDVDILGDYAIVGAPGVSSNHGRAYIYDKTGGNWTMNQNLVHTSTTQDHFGSSVAIGNNIAFVGAKDENKVYIYTYDDTNWNNTSTLTPTTSGVSFGNSISYDGTNLIIGDVGDNSAYIFTFDGTDWIEQKVTASDGGSTDHFGCNVSIDGNYAIVGAWSKNSMTGASYIFKNTGGTWSQSQKITASNGNSYDRFGTSVAIKNSTAVVGAFYDNPSSMGDYAGSAYIFNMPAPPAPVITGQPQNTTVCEGSTATFSITATNATSYQWYDSNGIITDGGFISGATTNQLSIAGTGQADEGNFYCIVTGDGGNLQSDNASLSVDELIIAAAGSDANVCEDFGQLIANDPPSGIGTWTVAGGSGNIDDPTVSNSDVSSLSPGANTFRWTIINGVCTSYDDMIINYDMPSADAGAPQSISTTNTTLDANPPAAGESGIWAVVSGSGILVNPSLYNTAVSGLSEGDNVFSWTVSNENCNNSAQVTINVDSGSKVTDNESELRFYPNPFNNLLYFENDLSNKFQIEIFTISGKRIETKTIKSSEGVINLSHLTEGVYIFKVSSGLIKKNIVVVKE